MVQFHLWKNKRLLFLSFIFSLILSIFTEYLVNARLWVYEHQNGTNFTLNASGQQAVVTFTCSTQARLSSTVTPLYTWQLLVHKEEEEEETEDETKVSIEHINFFTQPKKKEVQFLEKLNFPFNMLTYSYKTI